MNRNLRPLAFLLIILPIVAALYLTFNSEFFISGGYQLALDGYVISRTLIVIFSFYLVTKLGYYILTNHKKD
ncbi:hypothetical protein FFV09_11710 [Saccharibacillus brassicae]|uniref:Uncharacterized protein n=1 Tax=Saccharibacillus brassicae TaxID=2583377 RepID=A0A4Y6UZK7_SACBS|nr:hypothetical protein FFV09_11710 [Saccharibacillus brassicae]